MVSETAIAQGLAKCRDASPVPLLVTWVAASADTRRALHDRNLAAFDSGADAIRAAVAIARSSEAIARLDTVSPSPHPESTPQMAHVLTSDAAAEMLSGCGVPLAQSVVVTSAEAAAHFVNAGQSYAFKIVSPDIAHKSGHRGRSVGDQNQGRSKDRLRRHHDRRRGGSAPSPP